MLEKAKWIWCDREGRCDDWVLFRAEAELEQVPERALLQVAAETKYFLYINGELAVFEGSLFRESTPGNGYFDEVDVTRFLKPGKNLFAFAVWHFGNGGRNNVRVGQGGLSFACDALGLFSGSQTLCMRDPAHFQPGEPLPAYLYGGYNIGYDARRAVADWNLPGCSCDDFKPAVELGSLGDAPWGMPELRPVPLLRFGQTCSCDYERNGTLCTVTLPHAAAVTPWLRVRAAGGEVIDIRTDHYTVPGGPGDDRSRYNGHRAEYVCREGEQEFESLGYLYGERLLFTLPESVEVLALGCRMSGYDVDFLPVHAADARLEKLLEKCRRTLYVCMRDNFMDCPDRERGQWIGDVSVQAPQVFYALDERARPLLKKAILDFFRLRHGDVLLGNVPGENFCELPAQSLNAISELGMLAVYYNRTGDRSVLELAFEPCCRYLMLWGMGDDGLVAPRKGDWYWIDHLFNIDEAVCENAWYYSALRFAQTMADALNRHEFDEFLESRSASIAENFQRVFWKGDRFASKDFADDRANALAVVCGLASKEQYDAVRRVLISVYHATPYMEYYVLKALCMIGEKEAAMDRMLARYGKQIDSPNSTLWEDFQVLGTTNHAWSGGPLTILCEYFPELLKA